MRFAATSIRVALASSTRTFLMLRRIHLIGAAISPGESVAVAT
jgi:hypothetical protein